MRSIPNVMVIAPCDWVETRKSVKAAADYVGPVYVRLGREPVPVIFDDSYRFEIGEAVTLRDGHDVTIIANGLMVHEALKAHEKLLKEDIRARIIDLHTVKPIDERAIEEAARQTGAIVSAEEHTILGGVGGAVAEVVVEKYPVPMMRVGLRDTFGESGEPFELLRKFGLVDADIIEAARRIIKLKKR